MTDIKFFSNKAIFNLLSELSETKSLLSNIINSMSEFYLLLDREKNIQATNPYTHSLLGYKKYELINYSYDLIFTRENYGKIRESINSLLEEEKSGINFEAIVRTKEGKEIPLLLSVSKIWDKYNETESIILIGKNILERKRAEESLRNAEADWRDSFNSLEDVMLIIDRDYNIENINKIGLKLLGKIKEEVIGKRCYEVISGADSPIEECPCMKSLETKKVESLDRYEKRFGKYFSIKSSPIFDKNGEIIRFVDLRRDITERKSMEKQLRQSQKMEAIGTLAGGIAHDFNNLLTVIIGNAQLALMDVIKDESLRNGIEETMKAGERAASLTRQLLAFSRKQIIRPRVLDLNELLTGIEKMLGRLIAEDVELLTIPEPALWQVEVDPGQMEQVIMNLAINARNATPRGGRLTIETANIDLAENYFHEHGIKNEPGSYVMLAVGDTGCGMDKETQEHIFEPFFTTKEVGKGTGLGLATVYGIVKQNNGFIWVYSEPGQGSTFKVYLPRAEGDADSEEKQRLPVIELDGSETILIVEDDEGLRKFTQNALQMHGYKVLDAENGEDALKIGKEHEGPIHLMITDVVMPKMGGKEAAERLQPFYPQMKVIYMSGYTDNAIVQHGVLAPGLNFIQKPFSPEGLAHKVREVLDQEDLEQ